MAVDIKHATLTSELGVGDKVSAAEWDEAHDVTGLATVAETGAYADLTGTPVIGTDVEAHDATLTALAALNATAGLVEQTGADAFTKRAMGVGASTSVLTRADGDGRYALAAAGLSDGDKGDITVSGAGATWTIDNGVVTLAKMANMATDSFLGRDTAGAGAPEVLSIATVKGLLDLTGVNSGDQTSIVGITGTKAQFDTACTDGNFLYGGDVTQYTDELAQDAVGAMVDASLVYVDATPLLTRAALTGDATAAQGSNAVTVVKINGVALSGLATGILKNTTGTGAPSIAVAGDFPTLNQNTTGSAATLTTSRNFSIAGGGITAGAQAFNGSAAVVLSASVDAGHITLARMANVATATVFYRKTAGTGAPEVQTLATLKTDLGLTGNNSGDQTSVTGNAGTATALQTPRNINGVAFDGTGNITINAVDSTARVPESRTISTTTPLAGGGALSGNLTLTISAATTSAAGSMSAADKTKLDGIASGATANDTDANLKARANHTGTQDISTILAAATARIFGRIAAGAGAGEELTAAQVTAMLNAATVSLQGMMSAADKAKLDSLGGLSQIGSTIATTSGTSWVFINITQTFAHLFLDLEGFSTVGSANVAIEVSSDAGTPSTWAGPRTTITAVGAGIFTYGSLFIPGYRRNSAAMGAGWASNALNNSLSASYADNPWITWRMSGPIQAIRITSTSAGDAGLLRLWGC